LYPGRAEDALTAEQGASVSPFKHDWYSSEKQIAQHHVGADAAELQRQQDDANGPTLVVGLFDTRQKVFARIR
jgi:hypothetical protein